MFQFSEKIYKTNWAQTFLIRSIPVVCLCFFVAFANSFFRRLSFAITWCGKCSITWFIDDSSPDLLDDHHHDGQDDDDEDNHDDIAEDDDEGNYNDDHDVDHDDDDDNVDDDDEDNDDYQVRQMFNNPVHRRLLARLLKVELEVIPSRFPS